MFRDAGEDRRRGAGTGTPGRPSRGCAEGPRRSVPEPCRGAASDRSPSTIPAPVAGASQATHRLHPAEDLLHPLADTQAHRIAGMARRAPVDGRVLLLRDIVLGVVAAVGPQRTGLPAPFPHPAPPVPVARLIVKSTNELPGSSPVTGGDGSSLGRIGHILNPPQRAVLGHPFPGTAVASMLRWGLERPRIEEYLRSWMLGTPAGRVFQQPALQMVPLEIQGSAVNARAVSPLRKLIQPP